MNSMKGDTSVDPLLPHLIGSKDRNKPQYYEKLIFPIGPFVIETEILLKSYLNYLGESMET
ncbi:unnamed protein product, partial [Rotaria sp. Silwood2]